MRGAFADPRPKCHYGPCADARSLLFRDRQRGTIIVTAWQPDAYDRQRASEAEIINAKCHGERLGRMRAAERAGSGPYYEQGPPARY